MTQHWLALTVLDEIPWRNLEGDPSEKVVNINVVTRMAARARTSKDIKPHPELVGSAPADTLDWSKDAQINCNCGFSVT